MSSAQMGSSGLHHHQRTPGTAIGASHHLPGLSLSATATPTGSPKRRLPEIPPRRGPRDSFTRQVTIIDVFQRLYFNYNAISVTPCFTFT